MKKLLSIIAFLAIIFAGFSANAQVWKQGETLRIGHRGARALVDENTMESLKKAIEIGVDDVEFDIQRTKDNVFVVMHDPTVDRTTNGKGLISGMTLAEFSALKTTSGYTAPTLDQVLAYLKTTKVGIILDIKVYDVKCIPDVYAAVDKYGLVSRTVFETTSPKMGKAIEEFKPELVSAIYPAWPPSALMTAKKYKMDCISIYYPFASSLYNKMAQKHGIKFVVWTVDDAKKIEKFEKMGVDGVMTDDPNLFKQVSAPKCKACGK
jgi:glycerophosphoryl diester phosphodiesterase